jgi:subtilase family serine protease
MTKKSAKSRVGQRRAGGMTAKALLTVVLLSLGLLVTPASTAGAAVGPDLLPTIIKIVNLPVEAGKEIHFDSGVANPGGEGTGGFNIKWLVDGQEVGAYGSHEGVPAGSSKQNGNSQFYYTFDDPGSWHTITFIVDVDNHVAEINERNNQLDKPVWVIR